MSGSESRAERTAWGRWRPLWTLLGLLGLGVVATFLSSRRIRPMDEWNGFLDEEEDLPPRRRDRFPSTSVEVPGPAGVLHVEDGGTGGLPVLFVHGLAGNAAQWEAQLAHLRPERRALAVDLRGHGASQAPADGGYGIDEYADDVAAVIDELGLTRVVLVGHSLGASVVLEVARRQGDDVAGVLLVDPNGDQTEIPRGELDEFLEALEAEPRDEMRWYFKQVLAGAEAATVERVLADLAATPGSALVASLESSFESSPMAALEGYPGPVLSVISDMNSLPYSLHNLRDDLPVRLIAGCSHWLMLDRPDELSATLDAFLAQVEERAA